ncbi:MAG: phosphoenolpyruvate--protein phosphotransferase [Kiritimatiellae bacterium]|nr:phosphoenolpyruvate--protein phosphotransferase [Kiritimatiellia bacterium]HPC19899.1 phosphoenolpyruvate--protein phosphotransferase [Kiritimatiellia bacterium]HQN79486.1 phosphoenolpyruvate--protein phosphotransferase [Kiritimatiellia bacterium]
MSDFQKDNVALMCDIGELVGLFDFKAGLDAFLAKAVSTVAWHMRAAVCSIFLYEPETQELLLRASQGLNPDLVGHLRLKLGEGITGMALKEMRPICEARATDNPHFKYIPGSREEMFVSFLAVPILRKMSPVGVIVVEDPQWNYFTQNDIRALQVISSQLAGVIENAHLLMKIHAAEEFGPGTYVVRGLGASDVMGIGLSTRIGEYLQEKEGSLCPLGLTEADFDRAMAVTERQLLDLQRRLEDKIQDAASMIFAAHVLMLKDEAFSGEIRRRIRAGANPWAAILEEVRHYVELFSSSPNPAMREKVLDVEDLGHRLLHNLSAPTLDSTGPDYAGQIVIADELLPSDILKLSAEGVAGLILLGGGQHSHVAILAKALQIPLIVATDKRLLRLPEKTLLLLDSNEGQIIVRPGPEAIETMKALIRSLADSESLAADVKSETRTRDGTEIKLLANLNLVSELDVALRVKAQGIGLYRTEFPFIVRTTFPTEEEQYLGYRRVLERMNGRPVVFRTLDIGGDKALSYFQMGQGSNPVLGLRALRFSLRNPAIFKQQLRAMLRAAHGNPHCRIMFPMVASLDEFLAARNHACACQRELEQEGVPSRLPQLGVMIELPSAAILAKELADAADFLSIGSNDLIQYLLAVDRTNDEMADWFSPHHPAVLRTLHNIVTAAETAGKPLSLCGNLATDFRMLPFLLGIGLSTFSLDSMAIPAVQRRIAQIDMDQARFQARKMLSFGRIEDVAEYLKTAGAVD